MITKPTTNTFTELKSKLKKKFPVLTDSDLMFEESKKDEMFSKLQVKLDKTKDELNKIVTTL